MTPPRSMHRRDRRLPSARRGVGIAAVVIVLAALNLAVLGAVRATSDETHLGALRVETLRALYAAESAARIAVRCAADSEPFPEAGSTRTLGTATMQFVILPDEGGVGDIVVLGRSGFAVRRLSITIQEGP